MTVSLPFLEHLSRPVVWVPFGLVALVIVIGIVFSRGRLTGRRVFGIVALFFGVVITANLMLANSAISTFPGLEVKDSYVASQFFDADRSAQIDMGWSLTPEYDDTAKELRLTFTDKFGYPAEVTDLSVLVGRATAARDDTRPEFVREAGVFVAPLALSKGKWMMQIEAFSPDGTAFRQRIDLNVRK